MANYATGKRSKAISDRSGMEFPYKEMVREWNGSLVHISEFEPKQPQLEPKPHGADAISLQHVRTDRTEPPTPDLLPPNPFKLLSLQAKVEVSHPNSGIQVGDQVRLTATAAIPYINLVGTPNTMSIQDIELSTTLAADITASDTTLTLTDSSAFPSTGYIVVEPGADANETIYYGVNNTGTGVLSTLTRGTSAPTYNLSPITTTASAHSSGDKVRGSYTITKVDANSYTFTLVTAASTTDEGGGFPAFAGPVNSRP